MEPKTPAAYWESRLGSEFDLHGVGHQGLGQKYNDWLYRVRRVVFRRVVASLGVDVSKARVVDLGSGTGFYINLWLQAGARDITGVDITHVAVDELQTRFPQAHFVKHDIGRENPPLPPESFDLVSAFDVLFHIIDDDAAATAFRNAFTLLRPGGRFILSDHLTHRPPIRTDYEVIRPLVDIVRFAQAAGFEVGERRPTFVLMNSPADSESRARALTWKLMTGPARLGEPLGYAVGAALYPIERLLTRVKRESASTEVMVLTRPVGA